MRAFALCCLAGLAFAEKKNKEATVGLTQIEYTNTKPKEWKDNYGAFSLTTFWDKSGIGADAVTSFGYMIQMSTTAEFQTTENPHFTLMLEDVTAPDNVQTTTFQLNCIKNALIENPKKENWCEMYNVNNTGKTITQYAKAGGIGFVPTEPADNDKEKSDFLFLTDAKTKVVKLRRNTNQDDTNMTWNANASTLTYTGTTADSNKDLVLTQVDFVMQGDLASLAGLDQTTVSSGKGAANMAWQFLPKGAKSIAPGDLTEDKKG
jgi:hypothetical protein